MRLFLALRLSEEIRDALSQMQTRLQSTNADVRWVEPESLHLTVAFLGDLPDSLLPDIETVCAELAWPVSPFRLRVRGGSAFPKRGPNLKTLWVGVAEGAAEWKTIASRADEAFRPFGVPRSNELVPHVTLGRVRSDRNSDALRVALAAEAETECGEQAIDRLHLIQTFLAPSGATYRDAGEWRFGSNASPDAGAAIQTIRDAG